MKATLTITAPIGQIIAILEEDADYDYAWKCSDRVTLDTLQFTVRSVGVSEGSRVAVLAHEAADYLRTLGATVEVHIEDYPDPIGPFAQDVVI